MTYGDKNYAKAVKRISSEAKETGWFDHVIACNQSNISTHYRIKLSEILKIPRGGGCYIWKPIVIAQLLEKMNEGDVLVYCDSGCVVNHKGFKQWDLILNRISKTPLGYLLYEMQNDYFSHEKWCNDHVFDYFGISASNSLRMAHSRVAGIQFIKKCDHSMVIINKMLKVIDEDPWLFTDKYNLLTTRSSFIDHRHDQSIFSIISYIYNVEAMADNTWSNNWDELNDVPFQARRLRN